MLEQLTKFRRDLHRIPELDQSLPETSAYVEHVLSQLDCKVWHPYGDALCAFFDAGKEDTFAFRSDMDALPVTEATGLPFASEHPGCMHACGHDGHMALVLGLGLWTDQQKKAGTLKHNVLLIFQPAEETDGGAEKICRTGVMDACHVKYVFGTHLWPALPEGKMATRYKEAMAQSSELRILIHGRSSHVARYMEGCDATEAAALFLTRAYEMERHEVPSDEFRLLKFGMLTSGTVSNVISNYAELQGTLRTFSDERWQWMFHRMEEIAEGIAEETGCRVEVKATSGYPAVVNDEVLCRNVVDKVQLPIEILPEPFMITEDFSFYQKERPGVFFFLGTGRPEPLHAVNFNFDEKVLLSGLALYQQILEQL